MLEGHRFARVTPGVWRNREHILTEGESLLAATWSLPSNARLTHITRLQQLGLGIGPPRPFHFVIQGELHLAWEGIFLHRTKLMPPCDDVAVTAAAAFVAFCADARLIDAIKVGDWLLYRGYMGLAELRELALGQLWRAGAAEAVFVLEHLDAASRSLPESELRTLLVHAGLPKPEVNVPVVEDGSVIGDLVYRRWGVVVEYEGSQHQLDRAQYLRDIDRYARVREADHAYVQVTRERLGTPRTLVGEVFRALSRQGYDGPPPRFDERWPMLFMPVSRLLGPRKDRLLRAVG
jgi:hypothetical protein